MIEGANSDAYTEHEFFPLNENDEPTDKKAIINRNANGLWSMGAYEYD